VVQFVVVGDQMTERLQIEMIKFEKSARSVVIVIVVVVEAAQSLVAIGVELGCDLGAGDSGGLVGYGVEHAWCSGELKKGCCSGIGG
jgi:hypothetical protein